MFENILKIDKIDRKIITMLQRNPELSNSEISEKTKKSQPAVGARILKLRRNNVLNTQIGVNFKKQDIKLAIIEMSVANTTRILNTMKICPFVYHAFKKTGKQNITAFVAAPDIKTIGNMVDKCFRSNPDIENVNVNYVIASMNDLILPINFDIDCFDENGCTQPCCVKDNEMSHLKNLIKETRIEAVKREVNHSYNTEEATTQYE